MSRFARRGRISLLGILPLIGAAGWLPISVLAEDFRFSVGLEHFHWRELDGDGARSLKEEGVRWLAGISYLSRQTTQEGVFWGAKGESYFGNVGYDGYLQSSEGRSSPYSSRTHYWGWRIEPFLGYRFRVASWRYIPAFSLAVGGERWLRDLRGEYGYREHYSTAYLRVETGLESRDKKGWFGRIGMISPFRFRERVTGFTLGEPCEEVELSPRPKETLFLAVGYRFPDGSTVSLEQTGYMLRSSPREPVFCGKGARGQMVYQPRSELFRFSLRYTVPISGTHY